MNKYLSASLMTAMLLSAVACSNQGAQALPKTGIVPAAHGAYHFATYPMIDVHHLSKDVNAAAPTGSMVGDVSADGNSANLTAMDLSGNSLMSSTTTAQPNGSLSVQLADAAGTTTVSTINPSALHDGDNALPSGGNVHVDSTTGIVTADVARADGTKYHLTATPNSDGSATLEIVGSNGTDVTQRIAPPSGGSTGQAMRAGRGAKNNCKVAKDFVGYATSTGAIAAGVAAVAAGVGAEPVAAVAGGMAIGLGVLAGGTWLVGWAVGCEM